MWLDALKLPLPPPPPSYTYDLWWKVGGMAQEVPCVHSYFYCELSPLALLIPSSLQSPKSLKGQVIWSYVKMDPWMRQKYWNSCLTSFSRVDTQHLHFVTCDDLQKYQCRQGLLISSVTLHCSRAQMCLIIHTLHCPHTISHTDKRWPTHLNMKTEELSYKYNWRSFF